MSIHWSPHWTNLISYKEPDSDAPEADRSPFAGARIVWEARYQQCPACEEALIVLAKGFVKAGCTAADGIDEEKHQELYFVWPRSSSRTCPPEVPPDIREDFEEASEVLDISPKASAALSRRCLQHLLRNYAGVKKGDLADEIKQLVSGNSLSSDLSGQLDAIRNIGNFAAHPQKSLATGEILPVEPQEAEWNLDVLEDLFEHYFVKPAKAKKRKDELNAKLLLAGKPPIS